MRTKSKLLNIKDKIKNDPKFNWLIYILVFLLIRELFNFLGFNYIIILYTLNRFKYFFFLVFIAHKYFT